MKLLVTGGAGFIGSNFIIYWLEKHPEDFIVNFDALTYAGNLTNLDSVREHPHYTFIQGDITDQAAVEKAMKNVDVVVHFAAESHVDRSISDPSVFMRTNVLGTYVLLEVARKYSISRFHHISTDEVFGSLNLTDTHKFNEATAYDPRSPYAASKAGSDHIVRAYFHTYGLPITITNCSNNFGPFQHLEKLIPLTITNILQGKKVPVYGKGLNVRDWLYVEDHCTAIDAVLRIGRIGETYCVGGLTEDISNKEIVTKILNIMGKNEDQIEYVTDRPGHDLKYSIDWQKIKNELNWRPAHDFDSYLQRTINWYTSHELWWKSIVSNATITA